MDVLAQNAQDIASRLSDDTVIIELGSEHLIKSQLLLAELERQHKHVSYFLLDMPPADLSQRLATLCDNLGQRKYLSCTGLVGTVDDLFPWMANTFPPSLPKSHITFMSIGSQFPDDTDSLADGSAFLTGIIRACPMASFIFTVDSCMDRHLVEGLLYDEAGVELRRRISYNVLATMNRVLGYEAFRDNHWTIVDTFNTEDATVRSFAQCVISTEIDIDGERYRYKVGDSIIIKSSPKWSGDDVRKVVKSAGLVLHHVWRDKTQTTGIYYAGQEDIIQASGLAS
ncbi:hypothetical protein FE257_001913 [Aspergillus nanangensis]|uniref:Histidine-specific methyltransferase SAM-dependent domain-containing protein n=1 Tax=Aspergillus nanangensis TaxID=2582783 RepID=A0AAD4CEE3_ASPNN|nr:hypothetical protein FE257_001913 [Aspergillus nanangensis]